MSASDLRVQRMDAATQWLLRLRDEAATEQDIGEWLAWYEADEQNKKAFDEMQAFWRRTGAISMRADLVHRPQGPVARRYHRGWLAVIGASVAIVLALPIWLMLSSRWGGSPMTDDKFAVQEAPLPDGSKIELAAKTTVDVHYTEKQRTLEMSDGEAYFTVAPNHDRPFIVKVGDVRVRAVGTAFNIRHANDRVVVTVTDGVVDVYSDEAFKQPKAVPLGTVRAGSALTLADVKATPQIAPADPRRVLAWRAGRLEYIEEPLASVIADVSRYSSRPIKVRDHATAQLTFTGTVFVNSVDDWLQALPSTFPIAIVDQGDHRLVIARNETGKTSP